MTKKDCDSLREVVEAMFCAIAQHAQSCGVDQGKIANLADLQQQTADALLSPLPDMASQQ